MLECSRPHFTYQNSLRIIDGECECIEPCQTSQRTNFGSEEGKLTPEHIKNVTGQAKACLPPAHIKNQKIKERNNIYEQNFII